MAKPREDLLRDLFFLFEKQPRWAFAQLQKHTEQPTVHLKVGAAGLVWSGLGWVVG